MKPSVKTTVEAGFCFRQSDELVKTRMGNKQNLYNAHEQEQKWTEKAEFIVGLLTYLFAVIINIPHSTGS